MAAGAATRLVAAGDWFAQGRISEGARSRRETAAALEALRAADIAFVNLEAPLTRRGVRAEKQNTLRADPRQVDANMPCFRLGAFGTEGMQAKRINGLFSFVARPDRSLSALGLDLMGQAAYRLQETDDVAFLAAQCPSDVPALMQFYQRNFQKQGSFPMLERTL